RGSPRTRPRRHRHFEGKRKLFMHAPNGMNDNTLKKGVELRLDAAINGLQTALPAGVTSIVIETQSFTVADAIKLAQTRVERWTARRAARAAVRQLAIDADDDNRAAIAFLADLKAFLIVTLGRENEALTNFGFKPARKPRERSLEEKTEAAEKAKAT